MMVHDVIVIGAGVEGTSTAYQLAKRGLDVVLIEQFPWPHARGSSRGHTRALRKSYILEHQHYGKMADQSREKWRQIERDTGIEIYREIGVLSFSLDPKLMDEIRESLRTCGMPFVPMDMGDVRRRYPMFRLPMGSAANFEKEGGMVFADKALEAMMMLFKRHGGTLREMEPVTGITPGDVITVQTTRAVHQSRHLVITAGPWAGKLLKTIGLDMPLQPRLVTMTFWKEKQPGMFTSGKIPCFRIIDGHKGVLMYAIPATEYPGLVKLCLHDGPEVDPDMRDTVDNTDAIQVVSRFIQKYFPDLEDKPSVVENCIYTMTPDSGFILDTHPAHKNIVIGAGFSGHGFKLAPMVGQILSDLVTGQNPGIDMKLFSVQRFNKTARL